MYSRSKNVYKRIQQRLFLDVDLRFENSKDLELKSSVLVPLCFRIILYKLNKLLLLMVSVGQGRESQMY